MIRKLLLDVDGTLLDFEASAAYSLQKVFEMRGYPFSAAVLESYHRINNRMWEAHERGEMPRERVLTDRFTELFSALGITETGETFDPDFRVVLEEHPIFIEGAQEILAYLKQRYELFIVTNGVAKTQDRRLALTGLDQMMDGIFISERIGTQKPQREFFDYCFAHIGECSPDEVMLIGDSLSADILGANRAGIASVWFNPKRKKNPGVAFPDFEIHALQELKILL